MKNIFLVLLLMIGVSVSYAQNPIVVYRTSQAPVYTVEEVFTYTWPSDTTTLDTIITPKINLKGTLYVTDALHSMIGQVRNDLDTCTYTVAYQSMTGGGHILFAQAWTTCTTVSAQQLLPGEFAGFVNQLPTTTGWVRFRIIRSKGSTQSVASRTTITLHRY